MDLEGGISTTINVADINNDGYKEIFLGLAKGAYDQYGYIIGLRHDGTELFDIDNNVTTYSGFSQTNAYIDAGVAIADLQATGENQVVWATRSFNRNNDNYITCHSVKDLNGDHLPDIIWQNNVNSSFFRNPIVANVDNSPDGSMEIIMKSDMNSGWEEIKILDYNGNLLYHFGVGGTYGALAVADLDGDGDKEIIAGYTDGVYIWHHNGTPYSVNPVLSKVGYNFSSSPIVCDLDNDGIKEILIVATKIVDPNSNPATESIVYAIKPNGSILPGWGTNVQKYPVSQQNVSKEISVGDLNNDGDLEVVALGTDVVNIWNKSGGLINSINIPGANGVVINPILADVDGDAEIEIIFPALEKIHAIKTAGKSALGFPLTLNNASSKRRTVCVADLDNNGKVEIIAAGENKIYVWETNGNPNRIEWGSERHDPQNTGEYYKICSKTIIKSNTVWNSNQEVCDNIIIESGTLTLNSACTLTLKESSMIIVRPGANLVIDGGKILSANIKALSGSSVTLKNNGYVKLNKKGEFNICLGATFDYQYGEIDITP